MSTERSFVVKSIRRIALSAPALRQAMDAIQARGDQPASVGVGTSDADRDRLCCDGSTSSNPNPGVDERDTSDGQEGLDSGDPADISDMGGGCLDGVTDCATGEPVCFCGSAWVPPEGWDSPTDPPIDPDYVEGQYYWVDLTIDGDFQGRKHFQTCGRADDYVREAAPCLDDPAKLQPCGETTSYATGCEQGGVEYSVSAALRHCELNPHPICDEDPPLAQSWPEDGCTNLAIKSGTIVGSKYDPENDGTYSTPMEEIPLCDEFGNQFWLRPSSTGGWKTIDANKEHGYLWDRNNNKIAHIDGNEYSDPDV